MPDKPLIQIVEARPVGNDVVQMVVDAGMRFELWSNDWPSPGQTLIAIMPTLELATRVALSTLMQPEARDLSIYVRPDIVHENEPEDLLARVNATGPTPFWVVRKNPSDYPDKTVARCFLSLSGAAMATRHVMLARHSDEIEAKLMAGGYTRFSRATDDPTLLCAYI